MDDRQAHRRLEDVFVGMGFTIAEGIQLAALSAVLAGAVWAFFWAVGSGQFDDLDTPAMRIVLDDDSKPPEAEDS